MTKRALVIEGGGFRSAYAAGALLHLLKEAPDLHFDVVAANSASVIPAAFFVTRQAKELEEFWLKDDALASPKFLSFWRIPISWLKPLINIDYFFHDIFRYRYRLDLEKLHEAKTEFYVTVMHHATGTRTDFSNRDPEIYEAMRASCAVPWAYNRKIYIRGERYIDGFFDSIPLRIALEKGCTEIWIISTRPKGYRKGRLKIFEKIPVQNCRLLSKRHLYYNKTAWDIEQNPDYKILRPKEKLSVARFSNDLKKLREVFLQGKKEMEGFLKSL
ncbi:MAG: patatin-like phospholipase family protein [Deltaproteobacteria bacterium]|nr:patatin-like phospholipase family protein [Deltaproteobacteria bacterium]